MMVSFGQVIDGFTKKYLINGVNGLCSLRA